MEIDIEKEWFSGLEEAKILNIRPVKTEAEAYAILMEHRDKTIHTKVKEKKLTLIFHNKMEYCKYCIEDHNMILNGKNKINGDKQ